MKTTQKTKNKNTKLPRNKKLLIVVGVLLILLVIAYLSRGWLRMTITPKTVEVLYGRGIQNTMDEELNKLQSPFEALEYSSIDKTPAKCVTNASQNLMIEIECSVTWSAYTEIPQDSKSKAELNKSAGKLQSLLQQNGWEGEFSDTSEYTSLEKLIDSITSGIDYQPDAYYQKTTSKGYCTIDSNTAFASPKPPAIATRFSCTRLFNFFGYPTLENPINSLEENPV